MWAASLTVTRKAPRGRSCLRRTLVHLGGPLPELLRQPPVESLGSDLLARLDRLEGASFDAHTLGQGEVFEVDPEWSGRPLGREALRKG